MHFKVLACRDVVRNTDIVICLLTTHFPITLLHKWSKEWSVLGKILWSRFPGVNFSSIFCSIKTQKNIGEWSSKTSSKSYSVFKGYFRIPLFYVYLLISYRYKVAICQCKFKKGDNPAIYMAQNWEVLKSLNGETWSTQRGMLLVYKKVFSFLLTIIILASRGR